MGFKNLSFILLIFYHYAHNTGDSLYPFLVSFHLLGVFSIILLWFLGFYSYFVIFTFFSLFFLVFLWFKDSMYEGLLGYHTFFIQSGLKLSFMMFLFSEVMFFASVFWTYFDASLVPGIEIGSMWPSMGILSPHYMGFPFLNTLLLVSSGVSITWCHSSLLMNYSCNNSLLLTIFLAIIFLNIQLFEYYSLGFTIADSIYGTIFFFGTGFHGFHVLVGTGFLLYGYFWLENGAYSYLSHLSLECAILYWHFVDVVWLFLYLFIYWWGN